MPQFRYKNGRDVVLTTVQNQKCCIFITLKAFYPRQINKMKRIIQLAVIQHYFFFQEILLKYAIRQYQAKDYFCYQTIPSRHLPDISFIKRRRSHYPYTFIQDSTRNIQPSKMLRLCRKKVS